MAQQIVPAWKRMGLKLKNANEKPLTNGHLKEAESNGTDKSLHDSAHNSEPPKKRLKTEQTSNQNSQPTKITRSDSTEISARSEDVGSIKRKVPKKKVSFSHDTKPVDEVASISDPKPGSLDDSKDAVSRLQSQSKGPQRQNNSKPDTALQYLTQYHQDRSSWKFNKNREIWLLKHAFSETDIPRDYDLALSRYLHGLQGAGARERLGKECLEKVRDDEANSGKETNGTDKDLRHQFWACLQKTVRGGGTDTSIGDQEFQVDEEELKAWLRHQSRPQILSWSLDGPESTTKKPLQKKKKNRTAVVEYESSSSSGSDDESDSESDSDSTSSDGSSGKTEEETSSSGESEEATSSSGSSSSDSDDSD
ncbi:hypothetical protein PV10_00309 [Exophiala mesophila]|uniref:WKF domain-containing protein n=1 Tax=Exophiala mesophila TaxID=212818 RepID=A0A0D1ZPB4_EXOME|nr:uncharacterized protein PV10_00309 [Exophiala mesophila]KIV96437.1 hypothetical protein PV10_00309 [Exophiala mesophila]